MKKVILFWIIGISVFAQTPDPNKIIKEVKAKFATVKDYVVDATIKVDVSFIKMPDRQVKIYFKQPNKTHFESSEFAILPKMGLNFNPTEVLNNNFVAVYLRQDKLNERKTDVLNLVPQSDTAKVKFIKLWIDTEDKVIRKFELSPDRGGSVSAELTYGADIKMGLPSQIKFSMDFGGSMRLPANFGGAKKNDSDKKENKGTVIVSYSNYRINKGVDDKIFLEKKK